MSISIIIIEIITIFVMCYDDGDNNNNKSNCYGVSLCRNSVVVMKLENVHTCTH